MGWWKLGYVEECEILMFKLWFTRKGQEYLANSLLGVSYTT